MEKHLTDEYKKSVVHLYINGKSIDEITSEYDIPRGKFDFKKSHFDLHQGKNRVDVIKKLSGEHSVKILCKVFRLKIFG